MSNFSTSRAILQKEKDEYSFQNIGERGILEDVKSKNKKSGSKVRDEADVVLTMGEIEEDGLGK